MEKERHAQPAYILAREPRPAARETRMYPAPGKWIVRAHKEDKS